MENITSERRADLVVRPQTLRSRLSKAVIAFALAIATTLGAGVAMTVTASSASADECYTWSRTLRSGATGSDVTQLQIRVAGWVGYNDAMSLDGSYGPQTTRAVTNFQRAYGLTADGIAGPATFAKIYALQDADCTPAHFTVAEASYNCGRGFTGTAAQKQNIIRALWKAEALRHQLGDKPLRVTSGFRDYTCNKSVGGASNSRHLTGNALDLVPTSGTGITMCGIARQARYAGWSFILGPGYPDHNDHVHLDNASHFWRAPNCGI